MYPVYQLGIAKPLRGQKRDCAYRFLSKRGCAEEAPKAALAWPEGYSTPQARNPTPHNRRRRLRDCCWVPGTQGIGLPVEEALRFWRTEFAPVTPSDKFDKEYTYNIRHNYGVEGKRTNYTPYSCVKIISTPVDRVRPLWYRLRL